MGIIKQPRLTPLQPKDVIKRVPNSPDQIKVSVSIPDGTITNKGHLGKTKIKLFPREKE